MGKRKNRFVAGLDRLGNGSVVKGKKDFVCKKGKKFLVKTYL